MSALAKSTYFFRSAVQGVRHSPFIHFIAVLTIAIALFSAGLARGGYRVVDSLVAQLGSAVEFTIYLSPHLSPEEIERLSNDVALQTKGRVSYVSPAAALDRLRADLGEAGAALDELPDNPLPPSLELRLGEGTQTAQSLRQWAEQTRRVPGVTAVDYGQEALERLDSIATVLRTGGWVAFLIVVIATVVIISATLQLAIFARRDEIEIQKLVGATDRFVRVPFLMEGLLQGFVGAVVALLGLWAFQQWLGPHWGQLFSFLSGAQALRWVDARLAVELGGLGCGLGFVGSLVAVGRFLRV